MKKINLRKSIAFMAIIALIGGLVLTSLAYFTDSDAATNTFTVGKIDIKLEELLFNDEEQDDDAKRLVPGKTIAKDPTVTVLAKSEDSYVFMYVANNLTHLLDPLPIDLGGWKQVDTRLTGNLTEAVYVYAGGTGAAKIVEYNSGDQALAALFETVTVKSGLDNDAFANFDGALSNIVIKGYAHQAKANNLDIYATAEAAAKLHFGW